MMLGIIRAVLALVYFCIFIKCTTFIVIYGILFRCQDGEQNKFKSIHRFNLKNKALQTLRYVQEGRLVSLTFH